MGSKHEPQADRAVLAAYHEARLSELVEHIAVAVDRFRAGQLAAFGLDEVLRQHSRAARELWKFCWLTGGGAGVERTARVLRDVAAAGESVDWWQLGAPRDRGGRRASGDAGSPVALETRPENPTSS